MPDCDVLIIEDDGPEVASLTAALKKSGVKEVTCVDSAITAFIHLENATHDCLPKLIITNHHLPGMTGPEFLSDLQGMEKYKHIQVIVLSTFKTFKQLQQYKQRGELDYLKKPTTYDEYLTVAAQMRKGHKRHLLPY